MHIFPTTFLEIAVYATFAVGKGKPEKNSGLSGIRTLDLCDTGAALYQLNWTGIAEVKGSNPVQAGFFFRLSSPNCKSCVYNYDDHPSLKFFVVVVVVVLFCFFMKM